MGEAEEYKDIEYESLPDESSDDGPLVPRRKFRSRFGSFQWSLASFAAGCAGALIVMGVTIGIVRAVYHPNRVEDIKAADWNYCGHNSSTAMERGCVMDPALYAWLPPQCYFHELVTSLPPIFEDRDYFADEDLTLPITQEELYLGRYDRIFTMKYHDDHCLYQWRKLQYAIQNKMELVDDLVVDYPHSIHCANSLSVAKEPDVGKGQEIVLAFYRCRKISWP